MSGFGSVATLWPGFGPSSGETPPETPALTFAEALYAELAAIDDLTDLVGEEIHPQVLPQAAGLPAVSYQVVSNRRVYSLSGYTGHRRARVQINSISTDYPECQRIAVILADHFAPREGRYRGPLGGSIEVQGAVLGEDRHGDRDLYEKPREGSDEGRHMVALDLILRYREDPA